MSARAPLPRGGRDAVAGPPRSTVAGWSLVAGGAVSVVAVVVVFSSSGGLGDVLEALRDVSPAWVLAAVAAEVVCYLLLGLQLQRLAGLPRVSLLNGVRVSLLSFGLGNVLPGAPAPGMLLAGNELRRLGQDPRRTRVVLGFTLWFSTRTLVGIAAFAFLSAIARQQSALRQAGEWSLLALAVIAGLALTARMASSPQTADRVASVLGRLRFARPRPPVDETQEAARAWYADARAVVGTRAHRAALVAITAGSWLADAACLALALKAAGVSVDPDVLLLAYVGGMFITALPLLPGGIGAVEAAIPALLHHFGAPLDAALAGTLVYRGIALLLPAAAGSLVATHSELRHRRRTVET